MTGPTPWMRLLALGSIAGRPQVTLPVLDPARAPLGFSLLGYRGSDSQLARLAAALSA